MTLLTALQAPTVPFPGLFPTHTHLNETVLKTYSRSNTLLDLWQVIKSFYENSTLSTTNAKCLGNVIRVRSLDAMQRSVIQYDMQTRSASTDRPFSGRSLLERGVADDLIDAKGDLVGVNPSNGSFETIKKFSSVMLELTFDKVAQNPAISIASTIGSACAYLLAPWLSLSALIAFVAYSTFTFIFPF